MSFFETGLRERGVAPDDDVIAEGQVLGRFRWHQPTRCGRPDGDWVADPDGTHDGYIHRLETHMIPRTPATAAETGRAASPSATTHDHGGTAVATLSEALSRSGRQA